MNWFEGASMQFYHRDLTFYVNNVVISETKLRSTHKLDTFWRISEIDF